MLNRGFTLIEVLVSLLLLGMGMLGIVALAGNGQRSFTESTQRAEALRYVEEMADRIRVNPAAIANYVAPGGAVTPVAVGAGTEYDAIGATVPDCALSAASAAGSGCSAAQMAEYDRAWWDGLVAGRFGELGLSSPRGCINRVAGIPERARIAVVWQGMSDTADLGVNGALFAAIDCGDDTFIGAASRLSRRMAVLEVALP